MIVIGFTFLGYVLYWIASYYEDRFIKKPQDDFTEIGGGDFD